MAVLDDVLPLGSELERSTVVMVRERIKLRVGSLVYVAFSLDETEMEFAFPKLERDALIAAAPEKFSLPSPSDQRFHWVRSRLAALEPAEARELVVDAWRMVVPKKLARAYDLAHPHGPGDGRPAAPAAWLGARRQRAIDDARAAGDALHAVFALHLYNRRWAGRRGEEGPVETADALGQHWSAAQVAEAVTRADALIDEALGYDYEPGATHLAQLRQAHPGFSDAAIGEALDWAYSRNR